MNRDTQIHDGHLRSVLNAMPMPMFVMDIDLVIVDANSAAEKFIDDGDGKMLRKLCGEILHCLHAIESEAGCGYTENCPECVIRKAVSVACEGQRVYRKRYKMVLQRHNIAEEVHLLVTSAPVSIEEKKFSLLILEDISELEELRKLVPMCANCKKIRKDGKYWEEVERYMTRSLDIDLTHSICPDCVEVLYPDFIKNKARKQRG